MEETIFDAFNIVTVIPALEIEVVAISHDKIGATKF